MKANIVERKRVAEETLYIKFSLEEELNFSAGQFFKLTLIKPSYTDTRGNSRFFGFANSPSQNKIVEMVTRLGPSAFKKQLNEIASGTEFEISAVAGEMTLPENQQTPWIIVTGGVGIVPYISMFRSIEELSLNYQITLIYSNTKESWAIFPEDLGSFANNNILSRYIPIVTQDPNWQGEKHRIDEQFLRNVIERPPENLFYVSGTPRFVPPVVNAIKVLGVPTEKIKFEIFTGY